MDEPEKFFEEVKVTLVEVSLFPTWKNYLEKNFAEIVYPYRRQNSNVFERKRKIRNNTIWGNLMREIDCAHSRSDNWGN